MANISAFDVIGPNMIGPSSSHTAGALRIALLARGMARGKIAKVRFVLHGSFSTTYKGHGSDRALVGGILGYSTDDPRIKNSFEHARSENIEFSFEIGDDPQIEHPNTVDVEITTQDGAKTLVRGVSVGGGRAELRAIDGVGLKLSGEYSTLFVKQYDRPGVIAHITKVLAEFGVNIAFMNLYREGKSALACTVIEADETISENMIEQVLLNENIISATIIDI